MKDEKFSIMVDEPWDYDNGHGGIGIDGRIVRIISDKAVVFQSDAPKEFKGHTGRIFILSTRYVGETFDFDEREGFVAIVGGGLYLGSDYHDGDYLSLEKDSVYVLIGTLQKAKNIFLTKEHLTQRVYLGKRMQFD